MSIIISLLVLVVFVAVAIWLVNLLPLPANLAIIKTVLIVIIVLVALSKLFGYF
jgi:hypothetical protein